MMKLYMNCDIDEKKYKEVQICLMSSRTTGKCIWPGLVGSRSADSGTTLLTLFVLLLPFLYALSLHLITLISVFSSLRYNVLFSL